MANSGDHIVILHVNDGEQWANFFSKRLMGHNYGIRSELRNFSLTLNEKTSDSSTLGKKSSSSSDNLGDSGIGNRTLIDNAIDLDYTDNDKARVIILSPDILTFEIFPLNIRLLNPKRTLFLLLGVEIDEVRLYFGQKESDVVFKCRCCVIHDDETSICDAMVEIIKTYEYDVESSSVYDEDDNPYEMPPSSRQLNRIETMITRELVGKDRDAYFLLERPAEGDLVAVLDHCQGEDIPVVCVCDRLYKFTLADHVKGEIFFKVQIGSHCIGEGSVLAVTKLDRLKALLQEEVNPKSVIASALGLQSDDIDSIDTALALKLRQLSSLETLQKMFPFEESLDGSLTDERADVTYPSLLHFAADWNLRKFCSQLLQYPGMLDAAVMENKDGDDPRSLAFNKGFMDLESDLIQFVMDSKSSDNDVYISPSPIPPRPPPKSHSMGRSPGYINVPNSPSDGSGNYIMMVNNKKTDLDTRSQKSDTSAISLVSQASDNVFMGRSSLRDDLNEIEHNIFNPGDSVSQLYNSTPGATAKKALKMLGVDENDIKRSKPAGNKVYSKSEIPATNPMLGNIPHGVRYHSNSNIFRDQGRSNGCDNPTQSGVHPHDSKQKVNKIAAFFGKIKNKRSASEGENVFMPTYGVKKTHSTRSDKLKKKSEDISIQERDSGSYSDEENGKKSNSGSRRSSKPKEFKERDKPISRQRPLSKRAQMASKERIQDAPTLPTSSKRGGFTSFIETF